MKKFALLLIFLTFLAVCTSYPRYVVTAPDVFYVGVPQRVQIELYDVKAAHNITLQLKLNVQAEFRDNKVIASTYGMIPPDKPGSLKISVGSEFIAHKVSEEHNYVELEAAANGPELHFKKSTMVNLSYRDGIILIQTDKPIYTPKQTVIINVVPLGFDLMPSTKKINLIVKNPQGIRVQQWDNLDTNSGFITKTLDIGSYVLTGNWTIEAQYGHIFFQNETSAFEVREYVLPRFSVKVKGPNYILRDPSSSFPVSGIAKYTYGKHVQGTVAVSLSILRQRKDPPLKLLSVRIKLVNGSFDFPVKVNDIKNMLKDKWFPEGHRLQIQADVTEKATGTTERAVENQIYFVTSPYRIEYVNTARYFKPGLPFQLTVEVKYPNKKPAYRIKMRLSATAYGKHNEKLKYSNDSSADIIETSTDENGLAEFAINIARGVIRLDITVSTDLGDVPKEQNALKTLVAKASESSEMMKLRQNRKPAEVGSFASFDLFLDSLDNVDRITYIVVSRGHIVYDKTIYNFGTVTTLSFKILPIMSPSSRLVAYYISKKSWNLVSDSIVLDIEDDFPNGLEFQPYGRNSEYLPSHNYDLKVLGTMGTNVSLLAVDQSIYLLSRANLLTPESVFKKLEELDLGCGPGSGLNSKYVFKNAGMVVISEDITASRTRRGQRCQELEVGRKRRSIAGLENRIDFCCGLGNVTDVNNRSCLRRMNDLDVNIFEEQKLIDDCKLTFLQCCVYKFGNKDMGMLGRSFSGLDATKGGIENVPKRQDFKETWRISQIKTISTRERSRDCRFLISELEDKCGSLTLPATLPDTITTWVVQAIGVSNTAGFGIAKPLHITTFKPFFIYLSMPYSVQRGEEITILATTFNYKNFPVSVRLYLHGDKSFCSVASPGQTVELTEEQLVIKPQESASFSITIVPLEYGEIPIEVIAMGRNVDDRVSKKLLVVPEGVEERLTQSYVLDPQERLKDIKEEGEHLQNDAEQMNFDSMQNTTSSKQFNKINLTSPENAIAESISAKVYYTGNMIGEALSNLAAGKIEMLLKQPHGCGEQNMNAIAPNVYALHYLEKTKQMTEEMRSKTEEYIQKGYIHELTYRMKNGSFAAFREEFLEKNDLLDIFRGSTWLTAFVVKVFCQARQLKGVTIPKEDLCKSVNWLFGNQRHDGAFIEASSVIWLGKGGIYSSDATLTAGVIIALKQCECEGEAGKQAIRRATVFLENSVPSITDSYNLAITTYALALVNSSVSSEANQKLTQKATFNPATSSRYWKTGSRGKNVETAGYALLAQILMNRINYAGPIVVWLTKQRSFGGGFVSTADTCVALESISKFSERAEKIKLDLTITTNYRSKPLKRRIAEHNSLVQQSDDVSDQLGKELRVYTSGSGVGEMQIDVKYNVPSSKGQKCHFRMNVTLTEKETGRIILSTESWTEEDDEISIRARPKRAVRSKRRGKKRRNKNKNRKRRKDNKHKTKPKTKKEKEKENKPKKGKSTRRRRSLPTTLVMTVCAQYLKPGDTGMAIIDVGLLTGYAIHEDHLVKLIKKANSTISHYEISERGIVFYLDQIHSTYPSCISMHIMRLHEVGKLQPVPVKVYDYYEPENKCTVFYCLGKGPKTMGSCRREKICKCTQVKCPQENPIIANIKRTLRQLCNNYDFGIKGNVSDIDEQDTLLIYKVKVLRVVRKGDTDIKKRDFISFQKKSSCIYPNLEIGKIVFIMGQEKGNKYPLDQNAFVKILAAKDERHVRKLARDVRNGKCAPK